MNPLLGIDTGGTYTDAVLYAPDEGRVLRAAKALTTRHDLALGVGEAIEAVLPAGEATPPLGFVSLSTTLATNAVVEGQGSPVGLLLIGQGPEVLARGGLGAALGGDPVAFLAGGHGAGGEEQAPLDLEAARAALLDLAPRVAGFAVAGLFATRNPTHERRLRDLVRAETGLPVTCSHELSAALDAPRRALTALLNARLVPLLQALVLAVQARLAARGVTAPLMVVKGDGSLISAETALLRPVETILSGPAASVVGAAHLSGLAEGFVADVGGTTTDIALITAGRPALGREGATVGGWRTMVEAVAVHAVGLGGDSELSLEPAPGSAPGSGRAGRLRLGPRRSVPLALLARQHPQTLALLREQAAAEPKAEAGAFALRLRGSAAEAAALGRGERALWQRLGEGPLPLAAIATATLERRSLERLLARGLAIRAGFTPSDAAHLLGLQDHWGETGREAAALGAEILSRRLGLPDAAAAARAVVEQFVRQSAEAVADSALAMEGVRLGDPGLLRRALDGGAGRLLSLSLRLERPLIGVGGPAASLYPAVAGRLGTELVLPPHAAVCNAVGAVAGSVVQRAEVLVTSPAEDRFRVHLPEGPVDRPTRTAAEALAESAARDLAAARAAEAGAGAVEITVTSEARVAADAGGREVFVEARLLATAVGRPRAAA